MRQGQLPAGRSARRFGFLHDAAQRTGDVRRGCSSPGLPCPVLAATSTQLCQRRRPRAVLAVDVSGSMDLNEQRVQREGYVQAFRDPEVHQGDHLGSVWPHRRHLRRVVERVLPADRAAVARDRRPGRRAAFRRRPGERADQPRGAHLDLRRAALRGERLSGERLQQRPRAPSMSRATAPTTTASRWRRSATSSCSRASPSTACPS